MRSRPFGSVELMKKNPEMEHDEPDMETLGPGKNGNAIRHAPGPSNPP